MYITVRMTTFSFDWIVVMHISVWMTTISFSKDSRHAHFCTNDCHFFLNGLSSCTLLYEWLPSHFEWIVFMHISVRMTIISFWMDFRHARFCANDYHFFLNGFSSYTFLCEWLPFRCIWVFFMHIDFPYSCIWIFVMHILCKWLSIFFWFSMMCAMLFNAWIVWCIDEL